MAESCGPWQNDPMPAKSIPSKKPGSDRSWMFFALFVLVGLGALIPFAMQAHRDWRIMTAYREAEAEVLSFRLVPSTTLFRWSGGGTTEQTSQLPEFTFKFRVNGIPFIATGFDNLDGKAASFEDYRAFNTGGRYPCWYDPDQPERAVLRRHVHWPFYLGALIPGVFILMGGSLMLRSRRRRPDTGHVRVTDGTHFRCHLHPVLSHQRLVLSLVVIELVLLGALLLLWKASWSPARVTDLFGPMFYLFIIVAAIFLFIGRHLLRAWKAAHVPEPQVEIQQEPLAPGATTGLWVRQTGPIRAKSCIIELVCEEISSSIRTPVRELLLDAQNVHLGSEPPANERAFTLSITVPAKAKPSNRTLQSLRTWHIRVTRRLENGMTLESSFPFRVIKQGDSSNPITP